MRKLLSVLGLFGSSGSRRGRTRYRGTRRRGKSGIVSSILRSITRR